VSGVSHVPSPNALANDRSKLTVEKNNLVRVATLATTRSGGRIFSGQLVCPETLDELRSSRSVVINMVSAFIFRVVEPFSNSPGFPSKSPSFDVVTPLLLESYWLPPVRTRAQVVGNIGSYLSDSLSRP
jgi:hypothetical protein